MHQEQVKLLQSSSCSTQVHYGLHLLISSTCSDNNVAEVGSSNGDGAGADPNKATRASLATPLHRAAYIGHIDIVNLLCDPHDQVHT